MKFSSILIGLTVLLTMWLGCGQDTTAPTELNNDDLALAPLDDTTQDPFAALESRIAELESYLAANPNEEAAALLASAKEALAAARAAQADGDTRSARRYLNHAMALFRQAYTEAHHVEIINTNITRLETRIANLEATLGDQATEEVLAAIAKARELIEQAKAALAAGDDERASRLLREATGIIANINAKLVANARIAEKIVALRERIAQLEGSDDPAVQEALNRARQLLDEAQAKLDAGDARAAARLLANATQIIVRLNHSANRDEVLAAKLARLKAIVDQYVAENPDTEIGTKLQDLIARAEAAIAAGNTEEAERIMREIQNLINRLNQRGGRGGEDNPTRPQRPS